MGCNVNKIGKLLLGIVLVFTLCVVLPVKAFVDSVGDVGQHSSLAVDFNGFPHVTYYDRTNSALKYADKTSSSWVPPDRGFHC